MWNKCVIFNRFYVEPLNKLTWISLVMLPSIRNWNEIVKVESGGEGWCVGTCTDTTDIHGCLLSTSSLQHWSHWQGRLGLVLFWNSSHTLMHKCQSLNRNTKQHALNRFNWINRSMFNAYNSLLICMIWVRSIYMV